MSASSKSANKVVVILAVLIMASLPLLYVLSVGPALLLVQRGHCGVDCWRIVYRPIIFCSDKSKRVNDAFQWYIAQWLD